MPYDPTIPLLGINSEETITEKYTCTPMFIAALFKTAATCQQPRCPSTDEWINKLWYIYTMECYSTIKRNTFESVLMRWMNLEPSIQSEVSQKEKNKHRVLMRIYRNWKDDMDEPIGRATMEEKAQRTALWTQQGREREG